MKAAIPPSAPSLWFSLAPLGLLLALFALVGVLWLSGALRVSTPPTRPDSPSSATGAVLTPYRVAAAPNDKALRQLSSHLGFWNEPADEIHVLRYRGGLLECFLEVQENGQTARGTSLPESWPSMFQHNADLARIDANLPQEGYIAVARMKPTPEEQAPALHALLSGTLSLPAVGPYAALTPFHVPVARPQTYRILLHAGPGAGEAGPGFNVWSSQTLLPRGLPIASAPRREARPVGGDNLPHNEPITLWEQREGGSVLRLRGRFLSMIELLQQRQVALAGPR
jgi:hypothetical protein